MTASHGLVIFVYLGRNDAAIASIPSAALIDGEVVALDKDGRPSFQALQASLKEGGGTLAFFAFDLLEEDGESLERLPNIERKARLAALQLL